MSVLGHFKYHIYEVKLEGNDDETEYTLTCVQRTLKTINDPIEKIDDVQIYPFDDLRVARDRFEGAVQYCLNRTSFTDVSLAQSYMG